MASEESTSASGIATGHESEMAKGHLCLLPDPPPEAKARVEPRPEAPCASAWEVTELDDADLGMRRPARVRANAVSYEVECANGVYCLLPTPPTEAKVEVDGPTMAEGRLCLLPEDVSNPEMVFGRLSSVGDEPAPEAPSFRAGWGVTAPDDEELASRPTSIGVGYEVEFGKGVMCLLPEAPPEAHTTAATSETEGVSRFCLVPV